VLKGRGWVPVVLANTQYGINEERSVTWRRDPASHSPWKNREDRACWCLPLPLPQQGRYRIETEDIRGGSIGWRYTMRPSNKRRTRIKGLERNLTMALSAMQCDQPGRTTKMTQKRRSIREQPMILLGLSRVMLHRRTPRVESRYAQSHESDRSGPSRDRPGTKPTSGRSADDGEDTGRDDVVDGTDEPSAKSRRLGRALSSHRFRRDPGPQETRVCSRPTM